MQLCAQLIYKHSNDSNNEILKISNNDCDDDDYDDFNNNDNNTDANTKIDTNNDYNDKNKNINDILLLSSSSLPLLRQGSVAPSEATAAHPVPPPYLIVDLQKTVQQKPLLHDGGRHLLRPDLDVPRPSGQALEGDHERAQEGEHPDVREAWYESREEHRDEEEVPEAPAGDEARDWQGNGGGGGVAGGVDEDAGDDEGHVLSFRDLDGVDFQLCHVVHDPVGFPHPQDVDVEAEAAAAKERKE